MSLNVAYACTDHRRYPRSFPLIAKNTCRFFGEIGKSVTVRLQILIRESMNKRSLKQDHNLTEYPIAFVMAQAWSLSTKCRLVPQAAATRCAAVGF